MKKRNSTDVENHKIKAISKLVSYMDNLLSLDETKISKADKLSYWIEDWTTYLMNEDAFDSKRLRRYSRGEIIKVNLGFNVGSEEGGLHYALVIDNNNSLSDPTVRIVPLTSVKPDKDISLLPQGNVFLGNELFTSMSAKISSEKRNISEHMAALQQIIERGGEIDLDDLNAKVNELKRELKLLDRMNTEIGKMKKGSIALIKQITTISKMRIYDPKTNHDILSNIKLSNEKLDLVDECIKKLYTKA